METSIYIDSFKLKESEVIGFNGFTYSYSIDDNYFGSFGGTGYTFEKENLKLTFKNELVSNYIKRKFKIEGFNAETILKITHKGQYKEMMVDYTSLGEIDCCYVECTFKEKGGGGIY